MVSAGVQAEITRGVTEKTRKLISEVAVSKKTKLQAPKVADDLII